MRDTVKLPGSLTDNPRFDRWVSFEEGRTVRIASGKVEIGQGIVTALAQIAAEELDLPLGTVKAQLFRARDMMAKVLESSRETI